MPPVDHAQLRAYLAHPDRPAGTMSYHHLQGFLFAVAAAPEPVKPSEWMPLIFNESEPVYEGIEEARLILGEIMQLYAEVNEAVSTQSAALPDDCPFRAETMANFDDDAPMAQWSRGFSFGHQWVEEAWDVELPKEMDEELGSSMLALCFFGSRQVAEAFRAEMRRTESLESIAETVRSLVPEAAASYAAMGRALGDAYRAAEAEGGSARSRPKVGRNAPCPCGSGRKYKKCCGGATRH